MPDSLCGCRPRRLRQIYPDAHERIQRVDVIDPDAIRQDDATGSAAQAAREALRRRQVALGAGRTHLVETTLAGSGMLRHMEAARRQGYRIVLHYLSVRTPRQALDRIRNRVALGGHDVPEADVRRRFARSHGNLAAAMALADGIVLYDNTDPDRPYREMRSLGTVRVGWPGASRLAARHWRVGMPRRHHDSGSGTIRFARRSRSCSHFRPPRQYRTRLTGACSVRRSVRRTAIETDWRITPQSAHNAMSLPAPRGWRPGNPRNQCGILAMPWHLIGVRWPRAM